MATPQKRVHIVGAAREELRKKVFKKYKQGKSVRALAKEFKRSYGSIHRLLRESGATMRARGGTHGRARSDGRGSRGPIRRIQPINKRRTVAGASVVPITLSLCAKDLFHAALGVEMRLLRRKRAWTRRELLARLPFDLRIGTLRSWELGQRAILVEYFVAIFDVLTEGTGESVSKFFARVSARMGDPGRPAGSDLLLELTAASRTSNTALKPLRDWALCILRDRAAGHPGVIHLDTPALERLADLCGLDTPELVRQLTENADDLAPALAR